MITDRPNKILTIIKSTSNSLVLVHENKKLVCKTYHLPSRMNGYLQKRFQLNHPNLLKIYDIQSTSPDVQSQLKVAVIHEHYCRTLQDCLRSQNNWEDSQIINTFEPIIESLDYMLLNQLAIPQFSLRNIVVTEDQEVKFIDSFLIGNYCQFKENETTFNNFKQQLVFDKVAQALFILLFPHETTKSWKSRMKMIKERKSKEMAMFFSTILSKSLSKEYQAKKTKRIKKNTKQSKRKQNIQDVNCQNLAENHTAKYQKCTIDSACGINTMQGYRHYGKQNKLQQ